MAALSEEVCLEPNSHSSDFWLRSQLFTLRIWYELLEEDQYEVRMQVKHILSGETRYFRQWLP
jgi:hypothetical protein